MTADVAALPLEGVLNHFQEKKEYPYYRAIPTSMFPGPDAFGHMDAIEDILFIGYPSGIYDQANNLPITRRGLTATPLYVDYDGKPMFLIDASVFPGSSGSPVFLYNSGSWSDRGKALVAGNRVYLLGILASPLPSQSDGTLTFEEVPSTLRSIVTAQEMIDLGVVYKARTDRGDNRASVRVKFARYPKLLPLRRDRLAIHMSCHARRVSLSPGAQG